MTVGAEIDAIARLAAVGVPLLRRVLADQKEPTG
jgi:hypothetical protein